MSTTVSGAPPVIVIEPSSRAAIVAVWPNLIFSTGILSSDVLAACGFVVAVTALRARGLLVSRQRLPSGPGR